jgi:argininosuccinate synthase
MRQGMGMTRDEEIDYALERGIDVPVTHASPYSVDVNMWGRSIEAGVLEDPWTAPPRDVYAWTVDPSEGPAGVEVTLGFEAGIPSSLNGTPIDAVELIETLNVLGGRHGVGRIDHIEDRLVGIKSREIYEAPAAIILHTAHRALEGMTLAKEQLRFNRTLRAEMAQAIYDGLWYSALQGDLRSYFSRAQRNVAGEVRLRLDHGTVSVVGRRTPNSLYDRSLATYDVGDAFDHASAVGFIAIWGLPLRTETALQERTGVAAPLASSMLDGLPVDVTDAPPAGEPTESAGATVGAAPG